MTAGIEGAFAISQPAKIDINEIPIHPTSQAY